ncbi:DNA polymerase III subunit delta' [Thermovibrio sp.]
MLFNQVVGHSKQLTVIKELVEKGLFPNSSLFVGPEGVGKRLIGRELLTYLTGSRLNVKEVGVESPPTIEEVREVSQWLYTKPTQGKGKGVIIDQGELMKSEAANALLKTLEEPPPYGYLILISKSEEGVLPTIRSRCRVFRFGRLSDASVEFILERLKVDCDKRVIKVSRGSPGMALKLCESKEILELLSQFVSLMRRKDKVKEIVPFAQNFSKLDRQECLLFLNALETLLSQKETILKWADKIEKAREFLRFYGKPQSVIEWLLIEKLTS